MGNGNQNEPDSKNEPTGRNGRLPGGRGSGRRSFLKAAGGAAALPLLARRASSAPTAHHLEIVSTEGTSETNDLDVAYEFTTTGEITPDADNGLNSAEENDSVSQNSDGTWTATGKTGNGFGDAFTFEGSVTGFSAQGAYELILDGTTVTADDLVSDPRHHIEVLTTQDPCELDYTFTTTGEITKDTDNGQNSAAGNDSVTQNSDGTWTADGYTGNGYGDAYYFEGDLVDFGPVEDFVEIYVDGSKIDLSQFEPQRHHIEVITTQDPCELDYTFTTTGEITKDTDNGQNSASGNDSVSQNSDGTWTADGYTGNGYGDAYYFEGELTAFGPVESFVEVYVDGSQIDLSQYETTDDTTSSGSASETLGGGEGYANTVPRSEADVVVSTLDELMDAFDSASSGDVVYVAGDATIDASSVTGTDNLVVPAGVTLASDRGIDGAPGGRIKTDVIDYSHMMSAERNARVTGVRITGPGWEYVEYSKPVSSGLTVDGSGVEIDNVEVYGFSHAGIKLNASAHVHHSHIHHNSMDGLGYGIMCYGGQDTLVEYNRFNYNRHCVANEGTAGYEVRYNHFGGKTIAYQVGTHRPGGTTLSIHHNTFVPTKHLNDGVDPSCHVTIRGVPDDVADIHHNWFHNPKEPLDSPDMWTNEAIVQAHVDEWSNVEYGNNHYGSDEPSSDIGCPR
ncbi:right-handed parallel beta-helix repeat-containing protein [Halosimplex aquaticum]|uniref:Right-handed parallel beta-helix repeat-containing protein n=1 Tax=Halosimplex aquaticum TaxID=3026162 RepID=A0ABD5XTI4_9EURY|nr:right-handed parallel beta-helix repeat-containing protein [Halosimplex aquaticum]